MKSSHRVLSFTFKGSLQINRNRPKQCVYYRKDFSRLLIKRDQFQMPIMRDEITIIALLLVLQSVNPTLMGNTKIL